MKSRFSTLSIRLLFACSFLASVSCVSDQQESAVARQPATDPAEKTEGENKKDGESVTHDTKLRPIGPVIGKDYQVDLGAGVVMEFIWIDALSAWVGQYEVTNREFRRFRRNHDSGRFEWANRRWTLNDAWQPVVMVSHEDAEAFCDWLNQRKGLAGGNPRARLLNQKEWTMIARCGTTREYPWGDKTPPTRGNYRDITVNEAVGAEGYQNMRDGFVVSAPVERSGSNEWGLYGVGGNVFEWTSQSRGSWRAMRGASWSDYISMHLRVEATFFEDKTKRDNNVGFRVIVAPTDPSQTEP